MGAEDDGIEDELYFEEDAADVLVRSLITAAQRGDAETTKAIVRLHGAEGLAAAVRARTPDGKCTALAEAIVGGYAEVAEELLAAGSSTKKVCFLCERSEHHRVLFSPTLTGVE